MSIEITKTKEGLDVPDFSRFGPIEDNFDLILKHFETVLSKDET